jgi:hypothetical protein
MKYSLKLNNTVIFGLSYEQNSGGGGKSHRKDGT